MSLIFFKDCQKRSCFMVTDMTLYSMCIAFWHDLSPAYVSDSGAFATGVDCDTLFVWAYFSEIEVRQVQWHNAVKSLAHQARHLELNPLLYVQPVKLTKDWCNIFILSCVSYYSSHNVLCCAISYKMEFPASKWVLTNAWAAYLLLLIVLMLPTKGKLTGWLNWHGTSYSSHSQTSHPR